VTEPKADGLQTSTINLRILAAAVAFASKDEARYYINGVCLEIEPRAVTYIGTDGHRLIAYRDEKLDPESPDNLLIGKFIIPTAHCKPHKLDKEDSGEAKIFGTGRLTIAHDFCDVTFLPIDGVYPNWRKTVPQAAVTGKLGQYNLDYLASFRKFAVALDLPSPFVAHNGEEAPALVWYPGQGAVFGVIMPIKSTNELGHPVPEWARGGGDHEQADIEDVTTKAA
jgi:DNA polymerase-3 subunit beta